MAGLMMVASLVCLLLVYSKTSQWAVFFCIMGDWAKAIGFVKQDDLMSVWVFSNWVAYDKKDNSYFN